MSMKKLPVWLKAFLVNWIVGMCVIVPFLLMGNGYLTLSNDFNAQEIAFNMLMNEAVKSGEVLWNTGIDIGSNFIETFGFYNLGSPFVWLSLLFPASAIPRVIPWMFILKFAVAGAALALYFKRHSQNELAIVIGSILYAFSGFQCSSMLFYHFQDMVALFPFMMIGLEKLVEEQKKGYLALASAINCLTNLVFFVGEVIFLVLFFVIRYLIPSCMSKDKEKIKKMVRDIGLCMCEGFIGFLISGFITIPVVNGLLNVPRASNYLPFNEWFGCSTATVMTSLKAFFMPGEFMAHPSSVWGNDWMTNAAYLPLFGVVFVLAYCIKKKDWLSQLIKTCLLISFIPVLNNLFSMLSAMPYRRWYYMWILFMVLATVKVLERPKEYPVKTGAVISLLAIGFFSVATSVGPLIDSSYHVIFEPVVYCYMILLSVAGIALAVWYTYKQKKEVFVLLVGAFAVITMSVNIVRSQNYMDDTHLKYQELAEESGTSASDVVVTYLTEFAGTREADIAPYRYYFDEGLWKTYCNFGMTNSLQTTNSFISTVNGSIFKFYDLVGSTREVWTPNELPAVQEFLGAKYFIVSDYLERSQEYAAEGENLIIQAWPPTVKYAGYECIETYTDSNGFHFYVYENPNALPIGCTYDSYILESEFTCIDRHLRGLVLMRSLVVADADEAVVSGILQHYTDSEYNDWFIGQNTYADDVSYAIINSVAAERQLYACEEFEYGRNSFSAKKVSEEEGYTLFTIPYNRYWHAYVDGEEVEILDCAGLMAVRTEAGEKDIQFVYDYLPIKAGKIITCMGVAGLVCLVLYDKRKAKQHK